MNTFLSPLRVALFLLCALAVRAIVAQGPAEVGAPLIRLQTPVITKGAAPPTAEPSITLTGRVVAQAKVMGVMVGNNRTDKRVPATMKGDRGDFTVKVALAEGENTVVVMASDADNRTGKLSFQVRYEVPGAAVKEETVREPERITEVEGTVVDDAPVAEPVDKPSATTPAGKEAGVISRSDAMGGGTGGTTEAKGNVYAVVVGVSKYENDAALELRYAARDAQAFGEHLLAANGLNVPRANVSFLMNGEASAEAVRFALRDAASRAGANDLLIVYFAGHGVNDGTGRLCLLPYDASTVSDASMWSTGLTQSALLDALAASRSTRRLVILDACQSGLMAAGNTGLDARSLAGGDEGLCVLTATRPGESAHESDRLGGGHGLFSYALLQALKGEADGVGGGTKDGVVTLAEAYDHLRTRMPELSAELGGGAQQPLLHGASGASIILTRPGSGAKPTTTTGVHNEPPPVKTEQSDPRFVPIPEDKTEIDGVVFADKETGEKVRFFNKNDTWSDVSGLVNGVIFHGRAVLKGKIFEFTDQDAKNTQRAWQLDMSHDWSEVRVEHTVGGVTSTGRTLRRIGIPEREPASEGKVFADPVQDQRLQVVQQAGGWMRLTGNLGTRIVDLVAAMHGDVYDLSDDAPGWNATGRLVMSDRWDGLSGSLTFADGKEVPFVLRTQGVVTERPLKDVTYRDVVANQYEVTFYNEHPGSVEFNGNMRPGKVEVVCYKHGNVLHCTDNSGRMEPFRLLLKNDRKKLIGQAVLKTEKGIFVVDMNRVGN